jgi:hypothetical protein
MSRVTGFVGVYDADGGLRGELSYVVGKLVGTRHCSLCDVTHGTVRRRPAWDAMVARLAVPFELVHRNEVTDDVASHVGPGQLPVVLARLEDHGPALALSREQLEDLSGSVTAFEHALRLAVADHGWMLRD